MATNVCAVCGRQFETPRPNRARYCSASCRSRARTMRKAMPVEPDAAPAIGYEHSIVEVESALAMARRASNELAILSETAPVRLRPGCLRISRSIAEAIAEEGWM